jgi:hypothetical protein
VDTTVTCPIPPYATRHPFLVMVPPCTMLTTPGKPCVSSATPATAPQVLTQNADQHSSPG